MAQLNDLVRKLAVRTENPSPQTDWSWQQNNQGKQTVYFPESYQARSKPSEDASATVTFHKGEKAKVVEWQDNWILAMDSTGNTGWVQDTALKIIDAAERTIEEIMPQIISQLQAMKAKYQQGPIRVTGFAVDIKIPPGVSVDFEFK